MLRAAALAIILALTIAAQPQQQPRVLRGSVQQDVGLNTDPIHINELVLDLTHQVSIIGGSLRRDANAQQAFNKDLTELNALNGAGNALAAEYSACIPDYEAAFNLYWQAATLFEQNAQQNAKAINSDSKAAAAKQKSADKCANKVDWNKYQLQAQQNGGGQTPGQGGSPPGTYPGGYPPAVPPQNPNAPVPRNRYGLPRPLSRTSGDPCLPFGPGGYDYCANPTQPAGCDCSKRSTGRPAQPASPSPSRPTVPPVDAANLLRLAARMDQIVQESRNATAVAFDHFFTGLAAWESRNLRFLAQKPGVPVGQMSQAISQYLNNNYNANDRALRAAAVEAVQQMQNDPARFWGENLPNFAVLPASEAAAEIQQLENGAQRISSIAKVAENVSQNFGSNAARSLRGGAATYGSAGSLNARYAENACFPTALAQDRLWASGENLNIRGVYPNGQQDMRMGSGDIMKTLQRQFGGPAAQPNPALTPPQRLAIQQGVPLPVSSVADIERVLTAGGAGSRGLVFFRQNANAMGHVFNARNVNGAIEFWDAPNQWDGRNWFTGPMHEAFFYPTR